jgi:hypothetical protein
MSPAAFAQTATATITGIIQDVSGAMLSGITVTARSAETGRTRSTITDETGRYTIVNLEPGEYQLRAELQGFQTAVRNGVITSIAGPIATAFPKGYQTTS